MHEIHRSDWKLEWAEAPGIALGVDERDRVLSCWPCGSMVEPKGGIIVNDTSRLTRSWRSDATMLERLALVGFLAGYSGPTRDSYRTDLRLFIVWHWWAVLHALSTVVRYEPAG
jgi:hypothetical protein